MTCVGNCIMQANEACPLPCASGSLAGCGERFQCYLGCPACIPPPQNRLCNGFKQVQQLPAMPQPCSTSSCRGYSFCSTNALQFACSTVVSSKVQL